MSKTYNTGRNFAAVSAHMRAGAGSMRDKRQPRGGARNEMAELLAEMEEESSEVTEPEMEPVFNPFADEMEDAEVIWHGCVGKQEGKRLGDLLRGRI